MNAWNGRPIERRRVLATNHRGVRRSIVRLALAAALVTGVACRDPVTPETGDIELSVRFLQSPAALSSLAAILASTNLPTQFVDTIPLAVVSGTNNRDWTGGPETVPAANYNATVEGKDTDGTVTYRGTGTILVGRGSSRTLAIFLACVHSRCEVGNGIVSFEILIPELETEPNDTLTTANPLTVFSIQGGRWNAGLANGRIAPLSERDVFSLTLSSAAASGDSMVVILYVGTESGSSLLTELYDESGTILGASFATNSSSRLARAVTTGTTFRVRVRASTGSTSQNYTVVIYHCRPGGPANVTCS